MSRSLRVLVVDDSENDVVFLLRQLRRGGFKPIYEHVCTEPAMKSALQRQLWDIVISDFNMPSFDGLEALNVLKQSGRDIPFILVSGVIEEETAVAAMKAGAHDFIMKRNLSRLVPAIERELREAKSRRARQRAEVELRHSEAQFRQAQKMEAVGQLAAGIAHDFNNMLMAICGYSDFMLRRLKQGDPLYRNADQISQAADRAVALTRQLLAFSRKQTLQPKVLNLNDLIAALEQMLHRLIGENIEIVTVLSPCLGSVEADPSQVEQVIMNLAVNARDAMPDGGKLILRTDNIECDQEYARQHADLATGSYVMLSVSDTGTGMTDEVKEHLFEPFYTTKPLGKGTGLGLATCYGIVRQSGGQIHGYSEVGVGTTFTILLPQVEQIAQPVSLHGDTLSAPHGTETILLVEDEPAVRELGVLFLTDLGYEVLQAADGAEALRIAKDADWQGIDLLVTDVVMPHVGGRELAERLCVANPDTRVLFTSGYTEDVVTHHGVLEDGISFLQKPFTQAALAQKVREVLDSNGGQVPSRPSGNGDSGKQDRCDFTGAGESGRTPPLPAFGLGRRVGCPQPGKLA